MSRRTYSNEADNADIVKAAKTAADLMCGKQTQRTRMTEKGIIFKIK